MDDQEGEAGLSQDVSELFDAHCHLLSTPQSHTLTRGEFEPTHGQVILSCQLAGTQPKCDWDVVKSAADTAVASITSSESTASHSKQPTSKPIISVGKVTPALGLHPWFVWTDVILNSEHDVGDGVVGINNDVTDTLNQKVMASPDQIHNHVAELVQKLGTELHINRHLHVGEIGLDHAWKPRAEHIPTQPNPQAISLHEAKIISASLATDTTTSSDETESETGRSSNTGYKFPADQRTQLCATQLLVFNAQLALACIFRRQVSIHCVRAFGPLQMSLRALAHGGVDALCAGMPSVITARLTSMKLLAGSANVNNETSVEGLCINAHTHSATRSDTVFDELPKALFLHSWGGSAELTRQLNLLSRLKLFFGFSFHVNGTGDPDRTAARVLTIPRDRLLLESDLQFTDPHARVAALHKAAHLVATARSCPVQAVWNDVGQATQEWQRMWQA